jgi:hypothetical protein
MKTLTILIGNSDDKLTQAEWSKFVDCVRGVVFGASFATHFDGGTYPNSPYQTACWVVRVTDGSGKHLRAQLAELARCFQQDSVAVIEGDTEFVKAAGST